MSALFRSIQAALAAIAVVSAQGAIAAPALNPLSTAAQAVGDGLSATWVQVRDDARFSSQPWAEPGQAPMPIGSYGWGDGIWGTVDVPYLQGLADGDPRIVGRVSGTSAISFANATYNDLAAGGAYGTWGYDYARTLAPIIGLTGQQTNYAASFTGYIYIAAAGLYDFGLFADDGFVFSLSGSDGEYSVAHSTHAGSTNGRDYYTLSGANGDSAVELAIGYYGVSLDYYNRLEAGVIDLAWWQPGSEAWHSIGTDNLFDQLPVSSVPEPSVPAMIGVGGLVMLLRRRRM
ncbi:PEP-CTERM sorting domain-containing protein [Thauera sinica]|uniref:PEP-CTERM sorting domain-containing protein n=1 Tax=Thauera sinica TaxID=2665146 RepID=A0ABW1AS90_9RHOO|nr:PEP-CTERM sorting domain-containing protein [Thauera sp. K11]